jgi:DNA-binding transcriptional LysR family regulator
MRLRHIEVFHAVMQAGTISGAAQLLHISQPAATKALQHCELRLGMPLFDRVRGKLYATPEAQRLHVEVEKVNRDLVAIRRLAANLRSGNTEQLRFVCTPALGASVVPDAIMQWSLAFPSARCDLSTNHTREIVSALLLGEADLALALQDPRHPGIKVEVLASGPLVALCPLESPEGDRDGPLEVSEIRSEIIALAEGDPLSTLVTNAFEAAGLRPTSRLTVQTYQLARALAEAGAGLTVVDPFTASSADPSKVRIRPLLPEVHLPLYLLSAANAPLAQAARRLVKFLSHAAQARLQALTV